MKKTLIYIFLFLSIYNYSQNHTIVDSHTKIPLPYTNIKFINTEIGMYTNSNGSFEIKKQANDSVQISCLGYKTITKKVNKLKDTIFLESNTQNLKTVFLKSYPKKEKKIGFKKNYISFYNKPNLQLALFIKPIKKYENTIIKNILIPIKKKKSFVERKKKVKKEFNSVFKVHLFSNKNNFPDKPLLETPIIINCNQDSNKIISLDISKERIKLNQNGIFISLERIGEIDKNGNVLDKEYPRPGFLYSTKNSKDFEITKSFYKNVHTTQWEEMNLKTYGYKNNMFLAIQLILAVKK